MKKTMKKILALALVLIMTLPLVAVAVSATAPAYKSYAEATDGELLYKADFNGDSYWQPSASKASQYAGWGDGNWPCDNITVTPDSTDSSKAAVTLSSAKNAAWGSDIAGLSLGADYDYTITFTVVSTNGSKEGIAIFPDGQTGGYFYSSKARLQKGGSAVSGHAYVNYSGEKADQDYAIVVDGYDLAIYAKLAGKWEIIDRQANCYYDTESQQATFFNNNLCLYFYAYNAIDITVADVEVYKGLAATNLVDDAPVIPDVPTEPETPTDPETPTEPETPAEPLDSSLYDAGADGALLYTANFAGDEYFAPSSEQGALHAGWGGGGNWPCDNIFGTVDPTDSTKVHISIPETKKNAAWGGNVKGLPLGEGYSYTVKFTVYREENVTIGLLIDGYQGIHCNPHRARLQASGNVMSGHDWINYDSLVGTIPGTSGVASYSPSTQEYAFEINGNEYTIYVKDVDGNWHVLDTTVGVSDVDGRIYSSDYLGLYFYSYNLTEVDISNVQIYKGVSVLSGEGEIVTPPEDDGEEEVIPAPTPNKNSGIGAPELVVDETEAPETEAVTTEEKKGCGSSIGLSGAVLLVTSVVGMAYIPFRRNKDE